MANVKWQISIFQGSALNLVRWQGVKGVKTILSLITVQF